MKRNIIIAVIVIALLLVGYFMFRKDSPSTSAKSEPVAVSMIKRAVYHYNASSTKVEIVEPIQAFEGDEIETLDFGRALIQMKNGTLTTLDYLTKVTIKNHPDDEHAGMLVKSGKVWSSVEKVFGKGEYYEIETQNAVAVVRGTSFGVSFDGVNTILEVSLGTVLIVPIDSETGERLFDKAVLVPAGKKATVGNSGAIEIFDLTAEDTGREWYIYNNGDEAVQEVGAEKDAGVRISNVEIKTER